MVDEAPREVPSKSFTKRTDVLPTLHPLGFREAGDDTMTKFKPLPGENKIYENFGDKPVHAPN